MDITKLQKVYMIGIKGVGMTMLAQFLSQRGVKIEGSDTEEVFMTDEILERNGITIKENFREENIPADADMIIYSTAYSPQTNPEVKKVMEEERRVLSFAEALSKIFNVSYGIAVCGTHGKTTTTAWLGYVLWRAEWEPNVMVGAKVDQFGGSGLSGESDYLVIEADEYQNKLQNFSPKAVILNNIEHDHHDFFPSSKDYIQVFRDFVQKIPSKGFLVANYDDPLVASLGKECPGRVISYGIENDKVEIEAYDIKQGNSQVANESGKQFFKVRWNNKEGSEELGSFSIMLSGYHNIYNSLAVISALLEMGMGLKEIRTYLDEFSGTERRMQFLGHYGEVPIIDDYAHHPTEIRTTLAGVKKKYPDKRIVTVFHPHTYSRTSALLDDFAKSFEESDEVIVLDIYGSAREEQEGVHSRDLVERMKQNSGESAPDKVSYIPTLQDCEQYLRENVSEGDLVLLMGAGDVFRIGKNMVGI